MSRQPTAEESFDALKESAFPRKAPEHWLQLERALAHREAGWSLDAISDGLPEVLESAFRLPGTPATPPPKSLESVNEVLNRGWEALRAMEARLREKWAIDRAEREAFLATVEGLRRSAAKLRRSLFDALLVEQSGRCAYCGEPLVDVSHLEHRVPIVRGGRNDRSNLCLSCAPCNLSKRRRTADEFLEVLFGTSPELG